MRYIIGIVFIFIFQAKALAYPSGPKNLYNVVYDFSHDWLEYDQSLEVYTPFISENNSTTKVFSLKVNLKDYPGGYLVIKTPNANNYLFLNASLKKILVQNQWEVFKISDLINETKKTETIISIYGNPNPISNIVFIGYPNNTTAALPTIKKTSFLDLSPRNTNPFKSGLAIIFILNVMMISFLASNYYKAFKKYYNLKDLTAFVPKENSFLVNKPMDRPNMMFVIMVSLISGFIVTLIQNNGLNLFKDNFLFQNGNTFGILTINFFKVSLLIFISFLAKYFYINIIGKLFNIEKVVDIHYFKIIQSSIIFFSIAIITLLVTFNLFIDLKEHFKNIFTLSILFFYVFRTILIYFTINRTGNVKTLYLISYLCIVEVFPIVLGMRILL